MTICDSLVTRSIKTLKPKCRKKKKNLEGKNGVEGKKKGGGGGGERERERERERRNGGGGYLK